MFRTEMREFSDFSSFLDGALLVRCGDTVWQYLDLANPRHGIDLGSSHREV